MARKPHSHRELTKIAAKHLLKQDWCQLATWEIQYGKGVADVLAITTKPRISRPRILVAEVKRTRADLLADLKARKLLKYEQGSTHCVLAGTKEALGLNRFKGREALDNLASLGLPEHWGVMVLPTSGRRRPYFIRSTKQHSTFRHQRRSELITRIAISFCHRALNRKSPLSV